MLSRKNSDKKYDLHQNIKDVKLKAKILEDKAKMKEKELLLSGGAGSNPELGEFVSEMYLDALKAKLSILNTLQEKEYDN